MTSSVGFVDKKGEVKTLAPGFKEADLVIDIEAATSSFMYKWDEQEDLLSALILGLKDYFKAF